MNNKKLPVLATVAAAYRSVREHAPELALLARATTLAAVVAAAVTYGAIQLLLGSDEARMRAFLDLPSGERVGAITSLSLFIVSIGMLIIIVKWHRMIIRDVPPAETRRGATGAALLYFGRSLLLTASGFAIAIVCGLLPISLTRDLIDGDVRWWVALFCILGGIAAAIIVVGRLSLVLPAGAVGDYGVTLRRSWALTRGNSFRMFAGTVLSSGPVFLVNVVSNGLLEALPTAPASVPSLLAALTLSILLFVLAAVVQASFLSYAYKTLAAA